MFVLLSDSSNLPILQRKKLRNKRKLFRQLFAFRNESIVNANWKNRIYD
jgi:hypothetical protein